MRASIFNSFSDASAMICRIASGDGRHFGVGHAERLSVYSA
jgi:hypothetical protein